MYRVVFLFLLAPAIAAAESLTQLEFDSNVREKEASLEEPTKRPAGKVITVAPGNKYDAIKQPLAKIVSRKPLPAGTKIVGQRVEAFRIEDFVAKDPAPSEEVEVSKKTSSGLPPARKAKN